MVICAGVLRWVLIDDFVNFELCLFAGVNLLCYCVMFWIFMMM